MYGSEWQIKCLMLIPWIMVIYEDLKQQQYLYIKAIPSTDEDIAWWYSNILSPTRSTAATLRPTRSYYCHSEPHNLILLPLWAPQGPTADTLNITRSYGCHSGYHKVLLLPSWGPQYSTPAIFQHTNFYSCLSEAHILYFFYLNVHKLPFLPSQDPQVAASYSCHLQAYKTLIL